MENVDLERFLELFQNVLSFVQVNLERIPKAKSDVMKLLGENKLSVKDAVMKSFYLHCLHIELFHHFISNSPDTEGKSDLVSILIATSKESLKFVQKFPSKGDNNSSKCQDSILVLILKTAVNLKKDFPLLSLKLLEFLYEFMTETKHTSLNLLGVNFWLYDIYLDKKDVSKALDSMEKAEEMLKKFEKSFAVSMYKSQCGMNMLRLKVLEMQSKIVKANEEQEKDDGLVMDEVITLGDTNPFLGHAVSLKEESDLCNQLKKYHSEVQSALETSNDLWKCPKGYVGNTTICQIIHGIVALSNLFRQDDVMLDAIRNLSKFSSFAKNEDYQNIGQALEIQYGLVKSLQETEEHILQIKLDSNPPRLPELRLLGSLAWLYFASNQFKKATSMTGAVLCQIGKTKSSIGQKILSAELKFLATLCRCRKESFILYPQKSAENLAGICGGWQDMVVESPLELIYEAFKVTLTTLFR